LYRVAEMMEARLPEFAAVQRPDEVERSIDRWVWYAGFADKYAQVVGSSNRSPGRTSTSRSPSRPASSDRD
jgi:hypothetical protein